MTYLIGFTVFAAKFLCFLCQYFPAQDHVARFVTQVNDELQQQDPEDHMEGTEFVDLLDKYNVSQSITVTS